MPSLRSRIFTFILKYRHLLRFQLKRTKQIAWNTSIADLRQETTKGAGFFGKLPADLSVTKLLIGQVKAEWLLPANGDKEQVILYFHGGGYVLGSSEAHRPIVAKFVQASGVGALVFDYRLAPEHPFPAALDDAVAAYRWLLAEGVAPERIVFMGDSAGGGLCLATLVALRDQGNPLPAGAIALSPWTDLKNTGASLQTNQAVDTLTWADSWLIFSQYYAGENDPGLPWISPLYANLAELPPLLIYVGGDELLRDDSLRFAEKAQAAGVKVKLKVGKGLFHCYPACAPLFPEAKEALREIAAFIKACIMRD